VVGYSVRINCSAAQEVVALPVQDRRGVVTRIGGLMADPRPPGAQKLSGEEKYRIRQGQLRILYEIDDRDAVVTVVKVGHRRDVYR
jgi:mRNA interferase RelE/StbE